MENRSPRKSRRVDSATHETPATRRRFRCRPAYGSHVELVWTLCIWAMCSTHIQGLDESLSHLCESNIMRQSQQWKHSHSPLPKKSKAMQISCGHMLLTLSFDHKVLLVNEFCEKDAIVIGMRCTKIWHVCVRPSNPRDQVCCRLGWSYWMIMHVPIGQCCPGIVTDISAG